MKTTNSASKVNRVGKKVSKKVVNKGLSQRKISKDKQNLNKKQTKKSKTEKEFKTMVLILKPGSNKSPEECAQVTMTLAHYGTKDAIGVLKKFKKDPRAPKWIDCAIKECNLIYWEDTQGRQIADAKDKIKSLATTVFNRQFNKGWDKKAIMSDLKHLLIKQKVKFNYKQKVEIVDENKQNINENLDFIVDDILLVGIKPNLSDWIYRYKNGLEGDGLFVKNLEQLGGLTNFNSCDDDISMRRNAFDEFYEDYFYSLLEATSVAEGYLLDFSGNKLYGQHFSVPNKETGWTSHDCGGWCEGCLQEAKCEIAYENRLKNDNRRYRILKKLIKQITEGEQKINQSHRDSLDLECEIKTGREIQNHIKQKLISAKKSLNKKVPKETLNLLNDKINKLKEDLEYWDINLTVWHDILVAEQPDQCDIDGLKSDKEMYNFIKKIIETDEYRHDIIGLEKYYEVNEFNCVNDQCEQSDDDNYYHDPLCECDKYEPFTDEEIFYKYRE